MLGVFLAMCFYRSLLFKQNAIAINGYLATAEWVQEGLIDNNAGYFGGRKESYENR
jgi:hypothetical protein